MIPTGGSRKAKKRGETSKTLLGKQGSKRVGKKRERGESEDSLGEKRAGMMYEVGVEGEWGIPPT